MIGKVTLNFGWASFKVRLVLFWSWIWYGKLIFLKVIFKENFIYLKNVIWIYSRICLIRHHKGIRKKWRIRRSDELREQVKTLS